LPVADWLVDGNRSSNISTPALEPKLSIVLVVDEMEDGRRGQ
jgi:hypothetical protein